MRVSIKIVLLLVILCVLIIPAFLAVILTINPSAIRSVESASENLGRELVFRSVSLLEGMLREASSAASSAANRTGIIGSPFAPSSASSTHNIASPFNLTQSLLFISGSRLPLNYFLKPYNSNNNIEKTLFCRYEDGSYASFSTRGRDLADVVLYKSATAFHHLALASSSTVDTPTDVSSFTYNRTDGALSSSSFSSTLPTTSPPSASTAPFFSSFPESTTFVNGLLWNYSLTNTKERNAADPVAPQFGLASTAESSPSVYFALAWRETSSSSGSPTAMCSAQITSAVFGRAIQLAINEVINGFLEKSKDRSYNYDAFVLDSAERVLWSTKTPQGENPYYIVENVAETFGSITSSDIPADCVLNSASVTAASSSPSTINVSAACFHSIATYPPYELLRQVARPVSSAPLRYNIFLQPGEIATAYTPSHSHQAFVSRVSTSSSLYQLRLYYFASLDEYSESIQPALVTGVVTAVGITIAALICTFLILSRLLKSIESLSEKMHQDPWAATATLSNEEDEQLMHHSSSFNSHKKNAKTQNKNKIDNENDDDEISGAGEGGAFNLGNYYQTLERNRKLRRAQKLESQRSKSDSFGRRTSHGSGSGGRRGSKYSNSNKMNEEDDEEDDRILDETSRERIAHLLDDDDEEEEEEEEKEQEQQQQEFVPLGAKMPPQQHQEEVPSSPVVATPLTAANLHTHRFVEAVKEKQKEIEEEIERQSSMRSSNTNLDNSVNTETMRENTTASDTGPLSPTTNNTNTNTNSNSPTYQRPSFGTNNNNPNSHTIASSSTSTNVFFEESGASFINNASFTAAEEDEIFTVDAVLDAEEMAKKEHRRRTQSQRRKQDTTDDTEEDYDGSSAGKGKQPRQTSKRSRDSAQQAAMLSPHQDPSASFSKKKKKKSLLLLSPKDGAAAGTTSRKKRRDEDENEKETNKKGVSASCFAFFSSCGTSVKVWFSDFWDDVTHYFSEFEEVNELEEEFVEFRRAIDLMSTFMQIPASMKSRRYSNEDDEQEKISTGENNNNNSNLVVNDGTSNTTNENIQHHVVEMMKPSAVAITSGIHHDNGEDDLLGNNSNNNRVSDEYTIKSDDKNASVSSSCTNPTTSLFDNLRNDSVSLKYQHPHHHSTSRSPSPSSQQVTPVSQSFPDKPPQQQQQQTALPRSSHGIIPTASNKNNTAVSAHAAMLPPPLSAKMQNNNNNANVNTSADQSGSPTPTLSTNFDTSFNRGANTGTSSTASSFSSGNGQTSNQRPPRPLLDLDGVMTLSPAASPPGGVGASINSQTNHNNNNNNNNNRTRSTLKDASVLILEGDCDSLSNKNQAIGGNDASNNSNIAGSLRDTINSVGKDESQEISSGQQRFTHHHNNSTNLNTLFSGLHSTSKDISISLRKSPLAAGQVMTGNSDDKILKITKDDDEENSSNNNDDNNNNSNADTNTHTGSPANSILMKGKLFSTSASGMPHHLKMNDSTCDNNKSNYNNNNTKRPSNLVRHQRTMSSTGDERASEVVPPPHYNPLEVAESPSQSNLTNDNSSSERKVLYGNQSSTSNALFSSNYNSGNPFMKTQDSAKPQSSLALNDAAVSSTSPTTNVASLKQVSSLNTNDSNNNGTTDDNGMTTPTPALSQLNNNNNNNNNQITTAPESLASGSSMANSNNNNNNNGKNTNDSRAASIATTATETGTTTATTTSGENDSSHNEVPPPLSPQKPSMLVDIYGDSVFQHTPTTSKLQNQQTQSGASSAAISPTTSGGSSFPSASAKARMSPSTAAVVAAQQQQRQQRHGTPTSRRGSFALNSKPHENSTSGLVLLDPTQATWDPANDDQSSLALQFAQTSNLMKNSLSPSNQQQLLQQKINRGHKLLGDHDDADDENAQLATSRYVNMLKSLSVHPVNLKSALKGKAVANNVNNNNNNNNNNTMNNMSNSSEPNNSSMTNVNDVIDINKVVSVSAASSSPTPQVFLPSDMKTVLLHAENLTPRISRRPSVAIPVVEHGDSPAANSLTNTNNNINNNKINNNSNDNSITANSGSQSSGAQQQQHQESLSKSPPMINMNKNNNGSYTIVNLNASNKGNNQQQQSNPLIPLLSKQEGASSRRNSFSLNNRINSSKRANNNNSDNSLNNSVCNATVSSLPKRVAFAVEKTSNTNSDAGSFSSQRSSQQQQQGLLKQGKTVGNNQLDSSDILGDSNALHSSMGVIHGSGLIAVSAGGKVPRNLLSSSSSPIPGLRKLPSRTSANAGVAEGIVKQLFCFVYVEFQQYHLVVRDLTAGNNSTRHHAQKNSSSDQNNYGYRDDDGAPPIINSTLTHSMPNSVNNSLTNTPSQRVLPLQQRSSTLPPINTAVATTRPSATGDDSNKHSNDSEENEAPESPTGVILKSPTTTETNKLLKFNHERNQSGTAKVFFSSSPAVFHESNIELEPYNPLAALVNKDAVASYHNDHKTGLLHHNNNNNNPASSNNSNQNHNFSVSLPGDSSASTVAPHPESPGLPLSSSGFSSTNSGYSPGGTPTTRSPTTTKNGIRVSAFAEHATTSTGNTNKHSSPGGGIRLRTDQYTEEGDESSNNNDGKKKTPTTVNTNNNNNDSQSDSGDEGDHVTFSKRSHQHKKKKVSKEDKDLFYFRRRVSEISAALLALTGATMIEFFGDSLLGCFRLKSNFSQSSMVTRLCESLVRLQQREQKAHNRRIAAAKKKFAKSLSLRQSRRRSTNPLLTSPSSNSNSQFSTTTALLKDQHRKQEAMMIEALASRNAAELQHHHRQNGRSPYHVNSNSNNFISSPKRSTSLPASLFRNNNNSNPASFNNNKPLFGSKSRYNNNNNNKLSQKKGDDEDDDDEELEDREWKKIKMFDDTNSESSHMYPEDNMSSSSAINNVVNLLHDSHHSQTDDTHSAHSTGTHGSSIIPVYHHHNRGRRTSMGSVNSHSQESSFFHHHGNNSYSPPADNSLRSVASSTGTLPPSTTSTAAPTPNTSGLVPVVGRGHPSGVMSSSNARQSLVSFSGIDVSPDFRGDVYHAHHQLPVRSASHNPQIDKHRSLSSIFDSNNRSEKLKSISNVRIFAGIASFNARVLSDDSFHQHHQTQDQQQQNQAIMESSRKADDVIAKATALADSGLKDNSVFTSHVPTRPLTFFSLGIDHSREVCLAGKEFISKQDDRIRKAEEKHGRHIHDGEVDELTLALKKQEAMAKSHSLDRLPNYFNSSSNDDHYQQQQRQQQLGHDQSASIGGLSQLLPPPGTTAAATGNQNNNDITGVNASRQPSTSSPNSNSRFLNFSGMMNNSNNINSSSKNTSQHLHHHGKSGSIMMKKKPTAQFFDDLDADDILMGGASAGTILRKSSDSTNQSGGASNNTTTNPSPGNSNMNVEGETTSFFKKSQEDHPQRGRRSSGDEDNDASLVKPSAADAAVDGAEMVDAREASNEDGDTKNIDQDSSSAFSASSGSKRTNNNNTDPYATPTPRNTNTTNDYENDMLHFILEDHDRLKASPTTNNSSPDGTRAPSTSNSTNISKLTTNNNNSQSHHHVSPPPILSSSIPKTSFEDQEDATSKVEQQTATQETAETSTKNEEKLAEIDKRKKKRLVNIFIPNTISNLLPPHWKYHRCGTVSLRKEELFFAGNADGSLVPSGGGGGGGASSSDRRSASDATNTHMSPLMRKRSAASLKNFSGNGSTALTSAASGALYDNKDASTTEISWTERRKIRRKKLEEEKRKKAQEAAAEAKRKNKPRDDGDEDEDEDDDQGEESTDALGSTHRSESTDLSESDTLSATFGASNNKSASFSGSNRPRQLSKAEMEKKRKARERREDLKLKIPRQSAQLIRVEVAEEEDEDEEENNNHNTTPKDDSKKKQEQNAVEKKKTVDDKKKN